MDGATDSPGQPPGAPVGPLADWLRGRVTWRDRLGIAGVGVVIVYGIYGVTAWMTAVTAAPTHQLQTAIDAMVSFEPAWVAIYVALFPQALAPLVMVEERRLLARGTIAYVLIVLMGLPFWVTWPVSVPRDAVAVTDLFTWGVAVTRALDPPTNCFPSMHVAESWFAAFIMLRCDRQIGRVMLVGAVLIWWSTMAIHQHWFLDGLAGLAVALIADVVVFRLRPLPQDALRCGPRHRLLWMVALYAGVFIAAALPWWLGFDETLLPARPW